MPVDHDHPKIISWDKKALENNQVNISFFPICMK